MPSRAEKFILFYLGDETYSLPVLLASQFIEFTNLTLLPQINQGIEGLIYHNGHIVTIIDTKKILKIRSQKKNSKLMCLIFEFNGYYYGLLVDQGGETLAIKKTFNDRKKKVFSAKGGSTSGGKRYFRTKNKQKVYILEIEEILSQAKIYD